jgi:hypothetical protein
MISAVAEAEGQIGNSELKGQLAKKNKCVP